MRRWVTAWLVTLLALGPAALVWSAPAVAAAGKTKGGGTTAAGGASSAAATAATPPVLPGSTSPFSPGVPVSPPTVPTTPTPTIATPTSPTAGGGGLSGTDAILIAIGAVIILGGISFFIWRDARRHAPVKTRAGVAADGGVGPTSRGRTKPPIKSRKLSPAERRRRKRGRAR